MNAVQDQIALDEFYTLSDVNDVHIDDRGRYIGYQTYLIALFEKNPHLFCEKMDLDGDDVFKVKTNQGHQNFLQMVDAYNNAKSFGFEEFIN